MDIYLVGGAVRDRLLNFPVYDRDWVVVGATPEEMVEQGFRPVGKDFPVFIHPDTGEEYALARTERKSGKGYTGFQYHASPDVTLEQDLIRRDLTINAMAEDNDGRIFDPYHGQQDLQKRLLRHVSPAFAEDPLRVLRVARFAARYAHLGFTVADSTLQLMTKLSKTDELQHLTTERVWQEFQRALGEPAPDIFISILHQCHALPVLFPEFSTIAEDLPGLAQLRTALVPPARFALLLYRITRQLTQDQKEEVIRKLCERQRTPNLYRDMALQFCCSAEPLINFESTDAATRLQLIQRLNLLRKTDHLSDLLAAAKVVSGQTQLAAESQLPRLLDQMNHIEPQQLIQQGFKGKALGSEIQRRQLQTCQQQVDGALPTIGHGE